MKKKPNAWLQSEEFLDKIDFHNKFYLKNLAYNIMGYIKNAPIPLLTSWDPSHKSIYFHIGQDISTFFPVDTDIYYEDYIFMISKWAESYYPSFSIEIENEIPVDDEDIVELLKQGKSFEDAIKSTKKIKSIDKGYIEKVYILKDEFIFIHNDQRMIRISGTYENPISLSTFMYSIREIISNENKNAYDLRNFILENSSFYKIIKEPKFIDIKRSDVEMDNFIKTHKPFISDKTVEVDGLIVYWGKYKLFCNNHTLKDYVVKLCTS